MFSEAEITQSLTNYIQTELNQQQVIVTTETALIEAGLVDSLTIFKLILFMEQHFAIKIQPDDIVVEHFETLNSLKMFVASKLLRSA